ncbi:MAG: response regulator transcription factor [Chloroflexi bacterium]|nr:response regulator transcription factor [Chloroflexota bacterium]MBI3169662.1 response regulator transcription factor [Chloroflexota bacterium]
MEKRRVLLVCSQHLFGVGMETILRAEADVELIGPWGLGEEVCSRITETSPSVVLIVDDDSQSEANARLTSAIMEAFPNLPIIRARLTENVVRVHSTHILPARGTDLLETIRNLPETKNSSNERSE